MVSLSAKKRDKGKKLDSLRKKDMVPAVLYGPKIKNLNLAIDSREFEKVYKEAGESSLIDLKAGGEKFLVLIHAIQFDPVSGKAIHVDFYQPSLKEETEVTVPIVIEGSSPAVKTMGGTLVKNISEIEVKALPQNLPKEIKVNVDSLATFEDYIRIKDLQVPEGVKIIRDPEEILISVSAPEKEEEKKVAEELKPEEKGKEEKEEIEESEEKKEKEEKK